MAATQITSIDPVCGMTVDPEHARRSEHVGRSYYFCSAGCQAKFESDPAGVLAAYAAKTEEEPGSGVDQQHSCCGGHGGSSTNASGREIASRSSKSPSIYTCPMHPEVEQVGPGSCPICGMDLEPKFVDMSEQGDSGEYADMKRRLWVGVALSVPLLVVAMGPMVGLHVAEWTSQAAFGWLQFALATPVVFWCGWPLLVRGAKSFRTMNSKHVLVDRRGIIGGVFFQFRRRVVAGCHSRGVSR